MKKINCLKTAFCVILITAAVASALFGKQIKMLVISLKSFQNKNLAHTFQHTSEIQPTKKISAAETAFSFLKEENAALAKQFTYENTVYQTDTFLTDTKSMALLVVKDDVIQYERYFMGGNEQTLFSSNSMGKSFVSALLGIAVSEGYVEDIADPIGKYIPEFVGTDLENIPIRACLKMASGIHFNEDTDMSKFSLRTLLGSPAMKVIARYGVQEPPYTYRRYLSINTEILGKVITNATDRSLAENMEEKVGKRSEAADDAY